MAGAGYKLFQTGDVLTAAQVNTYLNEQTVMVFANAAARTSALTSVLAEGMVSYLQDTNAVEVYNGSAWVGVSGAGDVTEVQAGTGISVASGTGPIPVITNTVATAFDAAGDLVYGTGADTFTKLSLGTAGKVLTVNSGATAPEWATPAGGAGMTLISTTTLTGASVLISSIPATYNDLQIVIRNFKPTNDGHDLTIRVNDDSNANRHKLANDFSSVSTTAFTDTLWSFGTANDNTVSQFFGLFQIWDYANTTTWKLGNWYEMTTDPNTNTSFRYRAGRMMYNQTGAISSFRIATESGGGDLNGGEVLLYGVK